MLLLIIGIILGAIIGYKLNNFIKKLNKGIGLKILGYDLYIGKGKKADIVPIKNNKKKKATAMNLDKNKCSTCNDEDMFIAGTKSLIACPECKRNSNKFNKRSV